MRLAIAIVMIVWPVWPVSGRDIGNTTWAKSGVSYDQYRTDAIECAHIGYYRDISRDEPAKRYIVGSRAADVVLNGAEIKQDEYFNAIRRMQPERKIAQIQDLQTTDVHDCLVQRGYREVELSRPEAEELRKLMKGSDARRRYLHAIAAR